MDPVVHFEIPAEKLERAKECYSTGFGWKVEKWPVPNSDMVYYGAHTTEVDEKMMPKKPGEINGGLMQREETAKSPVIVMKVENIDESLKKILEAGGTVASPTVNIGGMGLYCRVRDTEGNVIGVWQDLKK